MLDSKNAISIERTIAEAGEPCERRRTLCGRHRAEILYTHVRGVPVTVLEAQPVGLPNCTPETLPAVLGFFSAFLEANRPDAILTIDADSISCGMAALAKQRDIPVVFTIHNFAYSNADPFMVVDYCTVPSEFAQRFYWDRARLACHALPNPVDWGRVRAEHPTPRFVTFVNPSAEKGAYAFSRIADELGRRRPEIPLLVVESRGTRDTLAACGLDPGAHGNITFMPNTSDPRRFWSVSRMLLMPSLWWESQGLVAVEAMINGLPVIASNRGALPETLGGAGCLLPLPDRLTPESRTLPTCDEVGPWVDTIIRLWDDQALYSEQSAKARKEAQRWHPDRLTPLYTDFYRNVRPQPGPPFLPKQG